jgi:diguanylate cyclase (GGDEF)-like protein/PAS domain S-box-containing protein
MLLTAMSLNLPENSESAQQREVLDALPAMVFLERAGKIVYANAEARLALGLQEGETIQRAVEDVLWGLFPGAAEPQTQLSGGRRGSPFHATLLARNGRMMPIEGVYCTVNAELREAVIVAHPAGRERAPRTRLMEDVLSSIPEAVVIVHEDHTLYSNPAFTRLFGYSADEVSGAHPREFIVPETRQHEIAMVNQAVDQHGTISMETVRKTKSGELLDVALLAGPLMVNDTKVGYAISYRDIGERKKIEARLVHDAMHDVLTGLPNRALFLDRLTLSFSRRARRREQSCGVLILDIDRFKEINATLGHATGDTLLVAVAARLRSVLRPQDTAARMGSDEFAVLVDNVLSAADLEGVAGRISRELQLPHAIYGRSIQASVSIGAAMAGPDHGNPESLIRDADYAMFRARQLGGGRFEVFDRRLEVHLTVQQERERELRHMIENRQFELWFEPVYLLSEGKLAGFESIFRSAGADRAADSFGEMLTLAEETGLSVSLGREMADAVCRQLVNWRNAWPALTLGVNLPPRLFYHPDMAAQLAGVLVAAAGADPSRLMFEVAESTLNENPDAAIGILRRLADTGVRLAVDEFGSSLAPMNHLVRLPVDVVKMDPSLTAAIGSGARQTAVIETMIHLGKLLGVDVVAQGIENASQLEALRGMGCKLGQGSYLSPTVDLAGAQKLAGMASWAIGPPA